MDPNTPNPFHTRQPYMTSAQGSYAQPEQLKTSAIAALLLSILVPPTGIVLAVIVLTKSRSQINRRIGIVSVFVGAFLSMLYGFFLVPALMNNLASRAADRDTLMKSHTVELQRAVGAYRMRHGSYPTSAEMKDDAWVPDNTDVNSDTLSFYTSQDAIAYRATPDGCKGTVDEPCTGFVYTLKLSTGSKDIVSVPYTRATESD